MADAEPATEAEAEPGGRRARFERSRVGQTVITYGLVIVLVALVVQNLPASVVREDLQPLDDALHKVGYDQDWTVFAPDPRPQSVRVKARLTYPDGSVRVWRMPRPPSLVAGLTEARWQKWQERVRLNAFAGLWEPTARWLVATETRDGQHPVSVELIRESVDLVPLDPTAAEQPEPEWVSQVFYRYVPPGTER